MRSKATQRIRDRKRYKRLRKIKRCQNLGIPFGAAARAIQVQVRHERGLLARALDFWFGLRNVEPESRGPRKPDQKDWEK